MMPSNWFVCCVFLVFCCSVTGFIPEDLECDKDFAKVGCYKDKRMRAFIEYKSFRGGIDWNNLDAWLKRLTCVCAAIARQKGSDYFGLQHIAECWTGTKPDVTYDQWGPSKRCSNQKFKRCGKSHVKNDSVICFGKNLANYVYRLTEAPTVCEDANAEECEKNKQYCDSYDAVRKSCPKTCNLCS